MTDQTPHVHAKKVPTRSRGKFMATLLGVVHSIRVQSYVFQFATTLTDRVYSGGSWDIFEVPAQEGRSKTFFMVPNMELSTVKVSWAENYYDGEMSLEALGITATLYTLGALANTGREGISDLFHSLRQYAITHPEGKEILAAID